MMIEMHLFGPGSRPEKASDLTIPFFIGFRGERR
jgi:hypothetical protein